MRATLLSALLAPTVVLAGGCRAPKPVNADSGNTGNFAGAGPAANSIPAFSTHSWSLLEPTGALSALHKVAQETPGAVQLLPGVPAPTGLSGIISQLMAPQPTGGVLASSIQPPPGCSSLLPTSSASANGSAPATSVAASTGTGSAAPSGPSGATNATRTAHRSGFKTSTLAASTSGSAPAKTHVATSSQASSTTASATTSLAGCVSPTARVEWRKMQSADQTALVKAIKCLMTTPPRSGLSASKSRWDDLAAVHQQMAPTIHGVGQFLTWHRQFLWTYEQELRNTCHYTGPLPWWDETKDAGNFQGAPMMTSQLYGSATDGATTCVTNGAFANAMMDIGPGSSDTVHCLARGVNETLSGAVTDSFVNACNSYSNFQQMTDCVFPGVHGYTHDALGGVMSDITSSPGDPLFFLHHAFIDRNYRNWQLVDPQNRTYAIGGYTAESCTSSDGGAGCVETTPNYVLTTKDFYPDITVAQAMDTQGGHLCYYYDS